MNIKVCGITEVKQINQLDGLGIDFAGMIFYKDSPRYVVDRLPGKDVKDLDPELKKVGVFVNHSFDEIMGFVEDYGLDVVQLHGNESPELCEALSDETEVIKVFRIGEGTKPDIDSMIEDYDPVVDYYLFDTGGPKETLGGTGRQFDWEILRAAKIEKPFFLSGGIGPDDGAKIKAFKHPDFYAVDLNSQFEKSPGVKDMGLILKFIQSLREGIKRGT